MAFRVLATKRPRLPIYSGHSFSADTASALANVLKTDLALDIQEDRSA